MEKESVGQKKKQIAPRDVGDERCSKNLKLIYRTFRLYQRFQGKYYLVTKIVFIVLRNLFPLVLMIYVLGICNVCIQHIYYTTVREMI